MQTKIFIALFLFSLPVYSQEIGDTQIGIQELEISLNRSRDDTIVVVGNQVAFLFPHHSQRATIWRAWPGIGHVSEQDAPLTDERCVLRIYPGYSQVIYFGVWFDDYAFPVQSPEYFLVVLTMPPLLDVNTDGKVNALDHERLRSLLGTRSANRRYDHRCDLNSDGWIDRLDWIIFEQAKYLN